MLTGQEHAVGLSRGSAVVRGRPRRPRRCHFAATSLFIGLLFVISPAPAQYYVSRTVQLPDTTATEPLTRLALPPQIADIRSFGMGATRIADDQNLSSFVYNPGLLGATDRVAATGSILGIAPAQTIDAVVFISRNAEEFEGATSLRSLQEILESYQQGMNLEDQVEEKLATLSALTSDLINKVVGDPDNPDVHAAVIDLSAQVQAGHWGFSLRGYGQTGMAAYVSPVFMSLLDIYLHTDFQDTNQAADAITRLRGILNQVIDPTTGQVTPGATSGFYALTYADIVATAAYGFRPADSLSVGVQMKILNRRFSASRISVDEASDFKQKLLGDLEVGVTGVTFDVGAFYSFSSGLKIGLNLQNLVPMKQISSGYTLGFQSLQFARDRDSVGGPIINADGDTALVLLAQQQTVTGSARLALPFLANVGVLFPVHEDWDVSFELVDVAQQESRYKNYAQRFGFGTEYRFHVFDNNLRVSPRIGFANVEATYGLGLRFRDLVQLDFAYYTSSIVQARRNIGLQVSVMW